MEFVIAGVLAAALLVGSVLLTVFLIIRNGESRRRAEADRDIERERLLQTPGERLRCVGCGAEIAAPLPALGCPNCHTVALILPESHLDRAMTRRKVG